ncbi:hypothetical protein [Mesorhizobium sp. B2-8-9]|uniref:hypothetical protein n=1 Tax=Mesorhizobium sp. B2-8-9 TaxID=2589899 RepID=UPI001126F076|nr:hypothetical protein [Mesorhizobium sp. B2-8-9]TPI86382.1 hypothetical protein FJ423_00735 [Mesorhizobium sp. B2-8-9]
MGLYKQTEIESGAVFAAAAWLAGMPIPELLQHLRRDFQLAIPVIWLQQFYDGMDKKLLKIASEGVANQGLRLWITMSKQQGPRGI